MIKDGDIEAVDNDDDPNPDDTDVDFSVLAAAHGAGEAHGGSAWYAYTCRAGPVSSPWHA